MSIDGPVLAELQGELQSFLNTFHEQNHGPDDIANCGHSHGVATTLNYLPLSQAVWEASWVDALEETPFCRVEES